MSHSHLPGLLIVISSPSGGGKTTVRKKLLEMLPDLFYSVSCTTRKPRSGEIDGKDYFFISPEEFQKRKEKNLFLEYAQVYQSFYGTPREPIDQALKEGKDVLLDVDTQGALQIQSKRKSVLVFILPPSLEILKGRLYHRKTDTDLEINLRLKEFHREIQVAQRYDYGVTNDRIDTTVLTLQAIILAERHRLERQREWVKVLENSIKEEM
ncbi:MAG: guanylate kinase [Chlamydiae bacterium]|nr:guanylate kinase [Chlamydiota bacterium]MBI3266104.1 guanylate kinase [Chlamydiota bacterium]